MLAGNALITGPTAGTRHDANAGLRPPVHTHHRPFWIKKRSLNQNGRWLTMPLP